MRPNIILISLDTVRADHMSCYGYYQKTTPNIDSIAADGAIFFRNYSTGAWTSPGHASMLTGLYVSEHGVYGERRLSQNIPTIAETLRENGYRTAGFVNNSQVGELVGLDRGHETFMEVWKGVKPRSMAERIIKGSIRMAKKKLGYEDMGAARTNRLFRQWIETYIDKKKPFYAFLHYIEPHNPFDPPQPYKNKYLTRDIVKNAVMEKVNKVARNPLICYLEDIPLGTGEIEALKALYDGEIEYTDKIVGEVVTLLKENKLYDDAMIIITADHGEHFGEHGMWSHVASLHDEVLHVPLIIKYPKGTHYLKEVYSYTQLTDIFPTVMEIAAVTDAGQKTSGVSLVHDETGHKEYHEYIFAEWEGRVPYFIQNKARENKRVMDVERFTVRMAMMQDGHYKYVWKSNNKGELYDISKGEEEMIDTESNNAVKERMHRELFNRSRLGGNVNLDVTAPVDKEIAENLRALGYM